MEKCWTFPGPAEQGQWGLSGRTPGFFFFLFITIFFDLLYLPFTQGRKCCLVARAEELEFWALCSLVRQWSLQMSRAGGYQPSVTPKCLRPLLAISDSGDALSMCPVLGIPSPAFWSTQQTHHGVSA